MSTRGVSLPQALDNEAVAPPSSVAHLVSLGSRITLILRDGRELSKFSHGERFELLFLRAHTFNPSGQADMTCCAVDQQKLTADVDPYQQTQRTTKTRQRDGSLAREQQGFSFERPPCVGGACGGRP